MTANPRSPVRKAESRRPRLHLASGAIIPKRSVFCYSSKSLELACACDNFRVNSNPALCLLHRTTVAVTPVPPGTYTFQVVLDTSTAGRWEAQTPTLMRIRLTFSADAIHANPAATLKMRAHCTRNGNLTCKPSQSKCEWVTESFCS